MLTLDHLAGNYDVIYSLGHNCLAAEQMKRSGLRYYSGPFDWMGSPYLSGVTNAMRNRFQHFMEQRNLLPWGIDANAGCYLVKDQAYGIVSNHDFPLTNRPHQALLPYPEFKRKMRRRTERMLWKLHTGHRILFIRTEGTPPELYELQQVLSSMIHGEFYILYVEHGPVASITPLYWDIPHVCAIQIPFVNDMFADNDPLWRAILGSIRHV